MKYINLIGQKFGRLTVVEKSPNRVRHGTQSKVLYKCLCDCGNYCEVITASLRGNITKSCGCIKAEQNKKLGKSRVGKKQYSSRTGLKYVTGVYFGRLKVNAKNRGLEFSVTIDEIENLLIQQNFKCKLSGLDIEIGYDKKVFTASLDRIDSSKGYVSGNVQWLHKNVNFMKQNYSEKDFIHLCEKIYFHSNKEITL